MLKRKLNGADKEEFIAAMSVIGVIVLLLITICVLLYLLKIGFIHLPERFSSLSGSRLTIVDEI